jgi:hypothetical protein
MGKLYTSIYIVKVEMNDNRAFLPMSIKESDRSRQSFTNSKKIKERMMNFEKQIITNFAIRNYRGNSADLIVLRTDARKNRQTI